VKIDELPDGIPIGRQIFEAYVVESIIIPEHVEEEA
jgi:hypothetical protein